MTMSTGKVLFALALGGSLLAASTSAQPKLKRAAGPPIAELRIAIEDMRKKEPRDYVLPGQVLSLAVGDEVRLRMVAMPAERHRAPRYPSCRFSVIAGAGRVSLFNVREQEGSALLRVLRTDDPRSATTVVRYQLLEPMAVAPGLEQGTITVDVEAQSAESPAEGLKDEAKAVTVYAELDFQGTSESFTGADPSLSDNRIGNDRMRSARVPEGCELILFDDGDYRGTSAVLTADAPDLSRTRVGNDRVSSLQVSCDEEELEHGAILYSELDFQGRRQRFDTSASSLDDTRVGNDSARSVRVAPGCRVTLYADAFFRGESSLVTEDVSDLSRTRVGHDRVSSIRVECPSR
jgi:hypothetical protein